MEVPPVDERDLDRRATQPHHGLKAAESAPDHDHSVDARIAHHGRTYPARGALSGSSTLASDGRLTG
jgi:hypothetical protein